MGSCLPFVPEGLHLLLVRVQYKDIIIYIEIILYVGLFVEDAHV